MMQTILKKINLIFILFCSSILTLLGQNVTCENPYPNCFGLNGIYFTDAQNGWAVGLYGIVSRYDGTSWSQDLNQTKTQKTLLNAFFLDANTGWICGQAGTILKYKDGEYTLQTSATTETINALFFIDENHGWAVCTNNIILKYNTGVWTVEKSNDISTYWKFNNVYMSSTTDGWAVGDGGKIYKYNGTLWSIVTSPTTLSLNDIDFNGNTGFIVGADGIILKFDETNGWTIVPGTGGFVYDLFALDVVSETKAWASGMYGTIIQYNGTSWTSGTASGPWYLGLSMTDAQTGWTFSSDGIIKKISNGTLEVNNSSIKNENGTPYNAVLGGLTSIALKPNGDGWMVSDVGALVELKSGVWKKQTTGLSTSSYYTSIDVLNDTLAFIVGTKGKIYKYNGTAWNAVTTPFDAAISSSTLYKVFILDAYNTYIVGTGGVLLHYGSGVWEKISVTGQTSTNFYDVQFLSPDLGWIVGANGTIINYKNGVFTKLPFTSTTANIRNVFYFDETEGWINSNSDLYHFKNNVWTKVSSDLVLVKGFFFSDRDNGYIIGNPYYQGGAGGVVSIYKNGTCTRLPNYIFEDRLMSIDFFTPDQGLIIGEDGLILRVGSKPSITTDINEPMFDANTVKTGEYYLVPNPASQIVTIYKKGSQLSMDNKVILITSLDGKIVLRKQIENDQIDISALNAGMYFLSIEGNAEIAKFIKE